MDGYERSFPDTSLTFQVRKVIGGGGVVTYRIKCQCQPQSQSLSSFSLDFGLETLDLGLIFMGGGAIQSF